MKKDIDMSKLTWNQCIGIGLIILSSLMLLVTLAPFAMQIAIALAGYKMLDTGMRMVGYPPISYWISWIRAQWRL